MLSVSLNNTFPSFLPCDDAVKSFLPHKIIQERDRQRQTETDRLTQTTSRLLIKPSHVIAIECLRVSTCSGALKPSSSAYTQHTSHGACSFTKLISFFSLCRDSYNKIHQKEWNHTHNTHTTHTTDVPWCMQLHKVDQLLLTL